MQFYIIVSLKRKKKTDLVFRKIVDQHRFVSTSTDRWSFHKKKFLTLVEFRSGIKSEMFEADNREIRISLKLNTSHKMDQNTTQNRNNSHNQGSLVNW